MRPSRTAAFFVHIVGRTRARRAVGRSLRDKPFPRYHATHGRDYPPPPEKGTRNTSPHDYFNYICTGIKHVTTMKAKTATTLMAAASLTLLTSACGRQAQPPRQQQEPQTQQTDVELRDYGAEPTVLNIDSYTLTNENFRTTLWTGGNLQLTVMAIPVGGEVGLEQHHDIDQFLRIEQGTARFCPRGIGRLCDPRSGRQMAQHPQHGTGAAETLLGLCAGGASPRDGAPHRRGSRSRGSRARALRPAFPRPADDSRNPCKSGGTGI